MEKHDFFEQTRNRSKLMLHKNLVYDWISNHGLNRRFSMAGLRTKDLHL
jgi:hypothetical protein